jgi:signal transduction histidine kinase
MDSPLRNSSRSSARLGGAIPLKRERTDLEKVCQEVLLEIQAALEHVVVAVHNCGAPIPEEFRHFLFEPLVRRASASADEGTSIGLGLFIARAIVASHCGEISFTSSETDGTTFAVRLPKHSFTHFHQPLTARNCSSL